MTIVRKGTDRILASGLLAVCVGLGGCRRAPEPDNAAASAPASTQVSPQPSAVAPADPAPSAPPRPSAEQATWTDPAVWTRAPSSSTMRLATYKVPKADGDRDDGEVSVFRFAPGKGGDVKANLERWEKQFSDVAKSSIRQNEKTIAGFAAHLLEIDRGTFASGMPGEPAQPKPNYGLLGAIVETPAGNYFFKLTGPEKTVKAAQRPFFAMLESIKVESAPPPPG